MLSRVGVRNGLGATPVLREEKKSCVKKHTCITRGEKELRQKNTGYYERRKRVASKNPPVLREEWEKGVGEKRGKTIAKGVAPIGLSPILLHIQGTARRCKLRERTPSSL